METGPVAAVLPSRFNFGGAATAMDSLEEGITALEAELKRVDSLNERREGENNNMKQSLHKPTSLDGSANLPVTHKALGKDKRLVGKDFNLADKLEDSKPFFDIDSECTKAIESFQCNCNSNSSGRGIAYCI